MQSSIALIVFAMLLSPATMRRSCSLAFLSSALRLRFAPRTQDACIPRASMLHACVCTCEHVKMGFRLFHKITLPDSDLSALFEFPLKVFIFVERSKKGFPQRIRVRCMDAAISGAELMHTMRLHPHTSFVWRFYNFLQTSAPFIRNMQLLVNL